MEPSIQRPWGNGTGIVRGLPVTEELSGRLLRLPMYAGMKGEELRFTGSKVGDLLKKLQEGFETTITRDLSQKTNFKAS